MNGHLLIEHLQILSSPLHSTCICNLRDHNWVHFTRRLLCTVILNSNFAILKKPEIVFNKSKRIIWAYSFMKRGDGFLLFLKAFSWETDLWVTLGDFAVKQRKIRKGNLYLTENWLSRNEMWCATDNHNNMCPICAKVLLDSNFNQAVIYKLEFFRPTASFL